MQTPRTLNRWWPAALGASVLAALFGCPQGAPVAGDVAVRIERVAGGLSAPIDLAALPDDWGLLIAEQVGRIRLLRDGQLRSEPYLDISDRVVLNRPAGDERGLLGLALHPDFADNGRLFVFYVAPAAVDGFGGEIRVSEFRAADPRDASISAATERILLTLDTPQTNHNGGQLAFGPDGMLYISIGDGGGGGDAGFGHTEPGGNAQDLGVLHGKLLRIDVNGALPYAIPTDNPFVDVPDARPEIYAYGFRNPWRFSFDLGTGATQRLFAADVGQSNREEISIVTAGGNYGWRIREGTQCFNPRNNCGTTAADGAPLIDPIIDYPRNVGISVIGGFVYRGGAIPALRGRYVFGDLTTGFVAPDGSLFAASEAQDGTWGFEQLPIIGASGGRLQRFVLALGRDHAGELYVLTTSSTLSGQGAGEVWRLAAP